MVVESPFCSLPFALKKNYESPAVQFVEDRLLPMCPITFLVFKPTPPFFSEHPKCGREDASGIGEGGGGRSDASCGSAEVRHAPGGSMPHFIDLLMSLSRGAVFHHGGVRENSPLALMGRSPSLMGRFPILMGRFPECLNGPFFPLENPLENSPLGKGALRGS